MNCTGLTATSSMEIRTYASVWGKECFAGCSNVPVIGMSDDARRAVIRIEDRAFYGCKGMTAFLTTKFSALQSIGAYAFAECDTLKQPSIPASVASVGEGYFTDCDKLTEVSFYGGVEEYPKYCFKNCPKLVRTGGTAAAFAGCTQMYTLQILAVTPPTIGSWTTCVFRTHGVHAGTGNVTPGQSGDTALESSFRHDSRAVSDGRQCMDRIRAYVGTSGGTAGFLCCCADPTEKAVGSVPAFHDRTGSGKRTERQNDVAGSLCASACRGENLPIL